VRTLIQVLSPGAHTRARHDESAAQNWFIAQSLSPTHSTHCARVALHTRPMCVHSRDERHMRGGATHTFPRHTCPPEQSTSALQSTQTPSAVSQTLPRTHARGGAAHGVDAAVQAAHAPHGAVALPEAIDATPREPIAHPTGTVRVGHAARGDDIARVAYVAPVAHDARVARVDHVDRGHIGLRRVRNGAQVSRRSVTRQNVRDVLRDILRDIRGRRGWRHRVGARDERGGAQREPLNARHETFSEGVIEQK
jgi:hypothetical protein